MNQPYLDVIIESPLFKGFTQDGARHLFSRGEVKEHAAGEVLIREGDASTFVILVLAGKLQVFIERQGREVTLSEPGPGFTVGELGVLCGIVRSASVRATTKTAVLCWSESAFRALLLTDIRLSQRIFSHLLRALIDSERSLIDSLVRSEGSAGSST